MNDSSPFWDSFQGSVVDGSASADQLLLIHNFSSHDDIRFLSVSSGDVGSVLDRVECSAVHYVVTQFTLKYYQKI